MIYFICSVANTLFNAPPPSLCPAYGGKADREGDLQFYLSNDWSVGDDIDI